MNASDDTRTIVLSGRRITQRWDGLCWTTVSDVAEITRAAALALPNTELSINGRCVTQLSYDERYGTICSHIWCECAPMAS